MKEHSRKITIFAGIALLLLVAITVLVTTSDSDSPDPTYPTIENGSVIYENAVDILNSTDNLSVRISYKKETLLGNEFLTEQSAQQVRYQGLVNGPLQASATETLIIGNQTVELSEIFVENQLFLTVDGCQFYGDMDAETYLTRYTPAQPLNADNYNTVTGKDTGNGYTISFSDPKTIESWVLSDETAVHQSTGTAHINAEGQLTKSVYTASYTVNNLDIRISVTVEIDYADTDPISLPDNHGEYIKLESPDAPRILEKACGYLLDATGVQGTCNDSIFCEAFGDQRNQTVVLNTAQDTTWTAQVDTTVEIINSSKAGTATNYTQREIFQNNTYSISVDNGPESINKDIDINKMRSYCSDLLVGTIMLPQYITGASITENEDTVTIELTGNDVFARLIDAEACTTLYQDANILGATAQSYTVDTMRCYLTVDKQTGLPIGSGLDYRGIYTIEQFPYRMELQSDHQYTLMHEKGTPR